MDKGKATELSRVIGLLSDGPVLKCDSHIFVGGAFMFEHQSKRISTAICLEVLDPDLFFSSICGTLDDVNSCRSFIGRVFCLGSGLVCCFVDGMGFHQVDVPLN